MRLIESRGAFSQKEQILHEADGQHQKNEAWQSRLRSLYSERLTERQVEKRGELPQQIYSISKENIVISVDMYNPIHDPRLVQIARAWRPYIDNLSKCLTTLLLLISR